MDVDSPILQKFRSHFGKTQRHRVSVHLVLEQLACLSQFRAERLAAVHRNGQRTGGCGNADRTASSSSADAANAAAGSATTGRVATEAALFADGPIDQRIVNERLQQCEQRFAAAFQCFENVLAGESERSLSGEDCENDIIIVILFRSIGSQWMDSNESRADQI